MRLDFGLDKYILPSKKLNEKLKIRQKGYYSKKQVRHLRFSFSSLEGPEIRLYSRLCFFTHWFTYHWNEKVNRKSNKWKVGSVVAEWEILGFSSRVTYYAWFGSTQVHFFPNFQQFGYLNFIFTLIKSKKSTYEIKIH